MRLDKIQKKTIDKLLDKYENSKTFMGKNLVNQSFDKKVRELFPKYDDDAEYELFCDINEALMELEKLGFIKCTYLRGDVLDKAVLNVEALSDCYEYVNRTPKRDEQAWLRSIWERFMDCGILEQYIKEQERKIERNGKVEYFDGDRKEYLELLELVRELSINEEEMFIRDFSIQLFKDSKRLEKLASRAQALMYQYGDYQEKESVLEECGIVGTPTYVCMKGNGILFLTSQQIDLSKIEGDIALSTASIKELEKVQVNGERIVTVENLTSFHDYADKNDFVVYLGGFHNKTKRTFLMRLYEQNVDKEYRHFGDIDAGGFYILEHLKAKTGIPFRSLCMDIRTLEKYMAQTKKLTENDRKRLMNLLERLNEADKETPLWEDYRGVLMFMLERDCKLEQEVVSIISSVGLWMKHHS